ncbi:MAG: thiamine pyrophosphate-dependent enzyme, partial [Planctomycetota bacterium]
MSGDPRATGLSVNGWNGDYLESQHEAFKRDPSSVPADIRAFFQGYELASGEAGGGSSGVRVEAMVQAYRGRGHLAAKLDPFGRDRDRPAALDLAQFGVTDQAKNSPAPSEIGGTLGEYIDRLERVYLGSVGVEFMHIEDYEERDWLIRTWESLEGRPELPKPQRVHVLELLLNSEAFEAFLQKRYPGEKRFSLEGAESLIPLLDEVLDALSGDGADEVVLGMAHRGRLNVLNQILGKTPEQIFTEFEDTWADDAYMDEGGDVKYHRGYSASRQCASGRIIHLAMASNPSHLEAVNPVVLGRARAKQRLRGDGERSKVVPILIHGDAAIAGQGIVAECLNFSQLDGYKVGGTIHVVVNNNIGFTTRPEDARSTTYCTDIAKGFGCPVFHVNGEDPEAVVTVAKLAAQYRQRYQKDVFIDMWCYRRYGHNEQDEQSFTQPLLARRIKGRESVLGSYADRLVSEQVLTTHDRDVLRERVETMLDAAQQTARSTPRDPTIDPGSARWSGFEHDYSHEVADTSVSEDLLREVCGALGSVPDGFKVNPKLKKLLEQRGGLAEGGSVSHADGEILAFGTLLAEGHDVRVSGQDCRRGTFSSRHAVLYDHETGDAFEPLNSIREMGTFGTDTPPGSPTDDGRPRQGKLCIYDSPLSEASVLGFDYGYSLADPSMLVCWEAQFGDFTNGAQVIIDQFIA